MLRERVEPTMRLCGAGADEFHATSQIPNQILAAIERRDGATVDQNVRGPINDIDTLLTVTAVPIDCIERNAM